MHRKRYKNTNLGWAFDAVESLWFRWLWKVNLKVNQVLLYLACHSICWQLCVLVTAHLSTAEWHSTLYHGWRSTTCPLLLHCANGRTCLVPFRNFAYSHVSWHGTRSANGRETTISRPIRMNGVCSRTGAGRRSAGASHPTILRVWLLLSPVRSPCVGYLRRTRRRNSWSWCSWLR